MAIIDNELDVIKINGEPFKGIGYNGLLTVNTKSYKKSPVRSGDGSIPNINDYATFIVPRADINFKYMTIEDYQRFCTAITPNEFNVEYFDKQKGQRVVHKMYVAPEEMTKIYNVGTSVIGVLDYKVSLIGTLNSIELLTVYYDTNGGTGEWTGDPNEYLTQGFLNQQIKIREGDYLTKGTKVFSHWNTKADGTGFTYLPNTIIPLTTNIILYAIYSDTTQYTLSLDYMGAIQDESTPEEELWKTNIVVQKDQPIGDALPDMTGQYDQRTGYTFNGWLKVKNTPIGGYWTRESVYDVEGNSRAYAEWKGKTYTVAFNSNGGSSVPITTVTFGQDFQFSVPTKLCHTFAGWYIDVEDAETQMTYETGKGLGLWNLDQNVTLNALWVVFEEKLVDDMEKALDDINGEVI